MQMEQLRVHFSFSRPLPILFFLSFFLSFFFLYLFIYFFCYCLCFLYVLLLLVGSVPGRSPRGNLPSSGRPPGRRNLQMEQLRVHFSLSKTPPPPSSFFLSSLYLSFFLSFFLFFFLFVFLIRSASACRIRSRTIWKRRPAEGPSGRQPRRRYLQLEQLRYVFSFFRDPSPFLILICSDSACRIRSRTTRKKQPAERPSRRQPGRRYLQMEQLRYIFRFSPTSPLPDSNTFCFCL